jgi:beta-glucosidase
MISFSSWNGVKMHANSYLITTVLKGELGFSGFVVTDWAGIDQIDGQPGFTGAEISTAISAGIDMVMVPSNYRSFISLLRGEVQAGRVPMSRIDDANRRILTKKFQLGLFERPLTDRGFTGTVGSAAHRALARQAVRESQVLLKNTNGILPLPKTASKIFVAGKSANDIGNQSGGWTISWQGSSGATTPGTTILQAIRSTVSSSTTVTFSANGSGIDGTYKAAIAVVGETPYAEGAGDRPGGMGLETIPIWRRSARCGRRVCRWWWCWCRAGRWTSPRSFRTGMRWWRRGCRGLRVRVSRTCCSGSTTRREGCRTRRPHRRVC